MPDEPYRAPPPVPPDPYAVAWATLRRRRVWSFVISGTLLVILLTAGYFSIWRHVRWAGLVAFTANLAQLAGTLLLPTYRFRCPHCGNRGAVWRKCNACGIRVGTPKSTVIEAEKQHAAGPPAEQAAEAGRHRVAEAQVAELVAADDDLDADAASRAHGGE
jgi:hypothetical protein